MFRYTSTISRQSTRAFTMSPRASVKVIPEAIQTPTKQPEHMAKEVNEKASACSTPLNLWPNPLTLVALTCTPAIKQEITGETNDKPLLNKDGAIGKESKKDGAIGGAFASDGAVGKNFNPDGAVGKRVNEKLGKK